MRNSFFLLTMEIPLFAQMFHVFENCLLQVYRRCSWYDFLVYAKMLLLWHTSNLGGGGILIHKPYTAAQTPIKKGGRKKASMFSAQKN